MSFGQSGLPQSPYLHSAIAALILMTLSIVNGYSFFFADSRSYAHGPVLALKFATGVDLGKEWPDPVAARAAATQPPGASTQPADIESEATRSSAADIHKDRGYVINRSIYYGALAYAGYALSDFWLTTYVQAYLVAAPIALLWFACLRLSRGTYYLTVAILALLSSLGVEVGLIMPDVFGGILILGAATLLAYWKELRTFDRAFLAGVLAFAVMAHGAHVLILLALILLTAALSPLVPAARNWASIVVCSAALAVGVLGVMAYVKAQEVATGHKAIVMPHIMASLIWKGPGYAYLVEKCPQAGFEICNDLSKLPQDPDIFYGGDPTGVFGSADVATQLRLSQEQARFALEVFRYDPVGVAWTMFAAGLQQAVLFSVETLKVSAQAATNARDGFPAPVADRIVNSRIARAPEIMDFVTIATYVTSICAALFICYFLFAPAWRADRDIRQLVFNWAVIAGLVVNAFVCGGLNKAIDRYGARVIWLLPLLALVDFACRRGGGPGGSGDASSRTAATLSRSPDPDLAGQD